MHNDIEDRLRQAARRLHTTPESSEAKSNTLPITHTSNDGKSKSRSRSLSKTHVAKRIRPKLAIAAAIFVLLGMGFYGYDLLSRHQNLPFGAHHAAIPKLPSAIVSQINDFVPYFFRATPQGFTFNPKNVSYGAGVLFFQVYDQTGNAIVISEQALSEDFANSKPQGDRIVSNVDGNGVITNRDGRTIGTLITSKTPRTLINVNASETVNTGSVEGLMTKLVPLSGSN